MPLFLLQPARRNEPDRLTAGETMLLMANCIAIDAHAMNPNPGLVAAELDQLRNPELADRQEQRAKPEKRLIEACTPLFQQRRDLIGMERRQDRTGEDAIFFQGGGIV